MISEKQQELMNEYRQLTKEWWKAIQAAEKVAGTDEFYPAMDKAETIDRRLTEISSLMANGG